MLNRKKKIIIKIFTVMKKNYQKPDMIVVKLQHQSIICASEVTGIVSGDGLLYGGSDTNYSGGARVKEQTLWDDEW